MLNELIADLAIWLSDTGEDDIDCGKVYLESGDNTVVIIGFDGESAVITRVWKVLNDGTYKEAKIFIDEELLLDIFVKLLNNRRRELQMDEREMIDREENEKNAASGHYDAYAAGATMANF